MSDVPASLSEQSAAALAGELRSYAADRYRRAVAYEAAGQWLASAEARYAAGKFEQTARAVDAFAASALEEAAKDLESKADDYEGTDDAGAFREAADRVRALRQRAAPEQGGAQDG